MVYNRAISNFLFYLRIPVDISIYSIAMRVIAGSNLPTYTDAASRKSMLDKKTDLSRQIKDRIRLAHRFEKLRNHFAAESSVMWDIVSEMEEKLDKLECDILGHDILFGSYRHELSDELKKREYDL